MYALVQRLADTGSVCQSNLCNTGLPAVQAGQSQVEVILQIAFGVIGAVALIYVILAGFQLTTSLGNPEALAKARQTIIFAAIGLAVALGAELIVTFVLGKL